MMDDCALRLDMVATQIAARGVRDARVLEAMREVPRHRFVPRSDVRAAYDDRPLPIGEGQTISQPYMVAVMTDVLSPQATDRVLEIGTGSGYQTAILARLAARVVSIERHAVLAARAKTVLDSLGIAQRRDPRRRRHRRAARRRAVRPDPRHRRRPRRPRLAPPATGRRRPARHSRRSVRLSARDDRRSARRRTTPNVEGDACVFVPLIGRLGWHSKELTLNPTLPRRERHARNSRCRVRSLLFGAGCSRWARKSSSDATCLYPITTTVNIWTAEWNSVYYSLRIWRQRVLMTALGAKAAEFNAADSRGGL